MTFQIAFSASDGVLLASDLKNTSLHGFHHSQMIPKIQVNESETLAYCSAGDSRFGNVLASVVEEEFSKGAINIARTTVADLITTQRTLLQCLRIAREREAEYINVRGLKPSMGAQTMFVFRQNGSAALWVVDSLSQIPEASTVTEGENIKSGDANSPAVFFPHWYFDKVPNTVDSLIPLAVHTVLMAKADYIEGVQVGVFTADRFHILTEDELKPYIALSKEIDSEILKRLLNGKDASL